MSYETNWDDVKDEHVGHTEENPRWNCIICKNKGWV